MNLQDKLYNDLKNGAEVEKDFSLEDGLLIYSGTDTENKLKEYKSKLNKIHADFHRYYEREKNKNVLYADETLIKADLLNKFIGFGKLHRYLSEQYKLKQAIDNGLSNDIQRRVGNCSGLSKLYAVLGLKEEFDLKYMNVVRNNSLEDHAMLKLKEKGEEYLIETTEFEGFDSKFVYKNIQELPVNTLFYLNLLEYAQEQKNSEKEKYFELLIEKNYFDISNVYNLLGAHNSRTNFQKTIENYDRAIESNPKNLIAYYNKGFFLSEINKLFPNAEERKKAREILLYVYKNAEGKLKDLASFQLFGKNDFDSKCSPNVANPEDFCEFRF